MGLEVSLPHGTGLMDLEHYLSVLKADIATLVLQAGLLWPWWDVLPDFLEEAACITSWAGSKRVFALAYRLGVRIKRGEEGNFPSEYRLLFYRAKRK